LLLLEMIQGSPVFPQRDDLATLNKTPEWARPIVQAAFESLQTQEPKRLTPVRSQA